MKKGVYETNGGSTAAWFGGLFAWDLETNQCIPCTELLEFIRPLEKEDYKHEVNLLENEDYYDYEDEEGLIEEEQEMDYDYDDLNDYDME